MSETPRTLVIAQVFPPAHGGSGRWLWELYRGMPAGTVHVAAGHAEGEVEFDSRQQLDITRVPLRLDDWGVLHPRSAAQYAVVARSLQRILRRVGPAVLHCAKALPEGALGWWLSTRSGIPYCCFVHGEELSLARTSTELRWLTARVLRGATRVIANSRHTERLLATEWGVGASESALVHPGVDTRRFRPAQPDDVVRHRLGWTGRRVVLTVGALQQRKGQDMFIRALPEIRSECPDVLYAMAGEGWERARLEALAHELGVSDAVQFRGAAADDELLECYQQCDLFALPNRQVGWDFEGFGMVLLEAQSCGKAVIAGASGGTAEAIDAPASGLIVDCATPGPISMAVRRLLRNPDARAAMGARGRDWCTENFDWNRVRQRAAAVLWPVAAAAGPTMV